MSTSFYDIGIWEEIRSTVCWKTDRLVESINKEIPKDTSLAEFQGKHPVPFQLREIVEQRANVWVQRLYDLCCDAYKSRGKTLSADFDRAVWFYRVGPFIMGETDSQIHSQTMGGFLNLLLCAVGSPPERRPSLTVSQKECCFDVRMKVYETWHDKLHHLPPKINEAAAAMAQANARERRAARIAAGLPPDNPPPPPATPEHTFRWEDLDHQLINLKLDSFLEQMQAAIADDERLVQTETAKRGNSAYFLPAFFEKQEKRTREWARKVYKTYCEVWQLQGGTRTLNFVKAVYERAVVPLIAARQGGAESQVMLRATRMGSTHNPQLPAAVGQWHRQIQNLRVSLWREFEIETSEWNYTLAQQAEVSKPRENPQNRGLPPDVSPKKTGSVTEAPPPISEVGGIDNDAPAKDGWIQNAQDAPERGGLEGAAWDTIEISFLSDERVQIRNGANSETLNYAEFGFRDGRSGKPNRAWEALRVLAAKRGIIRDAAKTGGKWPEVEKRIQEIRKVLRNHFRISADPIPFVEGTGYQALFKISCGPSFHT